MGSKAPGGHVAQGALAGGPGQHGPGDFPVDLSGVRICSAVETCASWWLASPELTCTCSEPLFVLFEPHHQQLCDGSAFMNSALKMKAGHCLVR